MNTTNTTIKQDWNNFSEKIAGYKGKISFENLYKKLKGHNLDEDLFDVYHGDYIYTIWSDFTVSNCVEVWENEEYFSYDIPQEETLFEIGKAYHIFENGKKTKTTFICDELNGSMVWGYVNGNLVCKENRRKTTDENGNQVEVAGCTIWEIRANNEERRSYELETK